MKKGFVDSGYNRYEAEFLEKVVNEIHKRVYRKQISLPINLKGMDARSEEINLWLKQSESQFLIISGIGGSGRSTLANYIVFNNMQNFESISIVEHIGSKCKAQQDMVKLQEQLCIDIAKGKDRRIPSVCQGTPQIEVLLEKRKALIVLDGISKESQLEGLIGSGNINKESKIIIITDNDISNWFTLYSKGYQKYQTKLLNDDESTELLCNIAFRSNFPMDGFEDLVKRVVRYCDGIPCALRVLGSSLSKQNSIEYWESVLKLFGKDFNGDIRKVLRISYDLLSLETEKELLLHIACFFVGKDKEYVEKILEPDYSAISGMLNLTNSCLLSISPNNKLTMNRLLQEMVRNFVVRESPILSERSRHWTNKDAYDMLRRGKSSEKMTGLTIDMNKLKKEDEFKRKQLNELTTKSLQNSDKLRLLQLDFVKMMGSCKNWSAVLRWLSWLGFIESTIPSDLDMGGLVALDMSYSFLKVFDPPKVLELLKIVNFSGSRNLLEIHNIDRIPNLETFILKNCEHLTHVCETIQHHKRITTLDMTGCVNLCNMEHIRIGGGNVQHLSILLPQSLERLFLNSCHLGLAHYSFLGFSDQSSLQYINLENGLFETLPCYDHLVHLMALDLSFCSSLKSLESLPSGLARLVINNCRSIEKITFENQRFNLQDFGYKGCCRLSKVEDLFKLEFVAKLDEIDMGPMMFLKQYEHLQVPLMGDDDLTNDRSCSIQMLSEFDIMSTSLPDINDPNLTPEYMSQSTSLSFEVPPCEMSWSLKGLNVTFRYTISCEDCAWFCKISTINGDDLMYNPNVFGKPGSNDVGIWLSYWPIGNTLNVGDVVDVSIVVIRPGLEVLQCGASLVYTKDDVAGKISENKTEWVETLGGDLSRFRLKTGGYYLCRRDFYELKEHGRLSPGWFSNLVGDTIDDTEVRGWRLTGRPQQSYQSYSELRNIGCINHGPEMEEIYKIAGMSKSPLVGKKMTSGGISEAAQSPFVGKKMTSGGISEAAQPSWWPKSKL